MVTRLELGIVLDDGTYLCDGCNVREPHEHRCHGGSGQWADGRSCGCPECSWPTITETELARLIRHSSRDRVLSLAWGPRGAAIEPSPGTAWALRLLSDWREQRGRCARIKAGTTTSCPEATDNKTYWCLACKGGGLRSYFCPACGTHVLSPSLSPEQIAERHAAYCPATKDEENS